MPDGAHLPVYPGQSAMHAGAAEASAAPALLVAARVFPFCYVRVLAYKTSAASPRGGGG
jgi:hypothetical protein